jgi:hypothetical protein
MAKNSYQYRIKAVGQSVYCNGFDEVKEQVLKFINLNNCGVVYEKDKNGIDVMAWRFEPYCGMVKA